jgi:hypothetical protein
MTPEECKKAQRLILSVIGSNLEQIATYEFMFRNNHSTGLGKYMIDYYKEWNEALERQFKHNSLFIKQGNLELVKPLGRREPPEFYEGL